MTLPASGAISLNQVNVELGNSGTTAINMNSADVRGLFGVASGAIAMSDGYGKSSVTFYGSRGVFAGGESSNVMDYITIATTGNATDFGDLTVARGHCDGLSNGSRGVFGGGGDGGAASNVIEYITIASTGNATDFGNLSGTRGSMAGTSNGSRGVFAGSSYDNIVNVIDYITIGSTGNATDFGDLTQARFDLSAASNVTSYHSGGTTVNVIDYITISSTGNATDFGDLTTSRLGVGATSGT